ncbi:hypothetical protein N7528_005154 [Penicillium herquei]|nr:hypothetical protein N7528_005154 [Penicillium herquei]
MRTLVSTYLDRGQWAATERIFLQLSEITKIKLEGDRPNTLTALGNLASAYQKQGRLDEDNDSTGKRHERKYWVCTCRKEEAQQKKDRAQPKLNSFFAKPRQPASPVKTAALYNTTI